MQFLSFVVLAQSIKIEEKKIEIIKEWPKSQLVRDIWIFLNFANFYKMFVRNFSKITTPLILIIRTTHKSIEDETQSI